MVVIDSWELLVAPIEEMSHSGACGRTSAVARFWTDLDRGSIFLAPCEVIGDPRARVNVKRQRGDAKREGDESPGRPAELELEIEIFLLMG